MAAKRPVANKELPRIALGIYEPRVKAKADLLSTYVGTRLDQAVDVTKWSMFLSFDIMGDVGFGKDFQNLNSGIEHPAIKGVHDHMAVLGVLGHVPWLLNVIGRIPGAAAGYLGAQHVWHSCVAFSFAWLWEVVSSD